MVACTLTRGPAAHRPEAAGHSAHIRAAGAGVGRVPSAVRRGEGPQQREAANQRTAAV